ncbi:hypothetical protein CSV79_01300 [Sporosarcina sp. P13]|nr:hypothetical protein CSV79_01300 [Sporosarcina sp. P13]
MTKSCYIVEDLLPLYKEDLLSSETEDWVNDHLNSCSQCKALAQLADKPITEEVLSSPIDHEKMMSKIQYKISLYQMIFIGMSFFLALQTTLVNDSFGFILSYTIMGSLLYLFYKSFKIVVAIAFLPVFFWSISSSFSMNTNEIGYPTTTLLQHFFQSIVGSSLIAVIHLAFALVGALIGYLIFKIKESGENK